MRRGWAGTLLALACVPWAPGAAAYCRYGTRWRGPVVDVVLQHQAHQRLCTDDAVPCNTLSRAALETTIRATLDEFYDSAGANLRLRYAGPCYIDTPAGRRLCTDSEVPPGKLVIRAKPCSSNGQGWNGDDDGDGYSDRAFAELCTLNTESPPVPKIYSSYPGQPRTTLSVQGVLMHELSHAIGFAHPDECGETAGASVLYGTSRPHLTRYDLEGLQALYGLRVGETIQLAWSNLFYPTTWTSGSASSQGNQALSRFSACDNLTRGGTHVAFTGRSPRFLNLLTHRDDGSTELTSVVPSYLPGHVVLSSAHPGLACQDFEHLRLFYAEDTTAAHQTIRYLESADAGQSWGAVLSADPALTQIHAGVDAAYDPATGYYVYAYRNDNSLIATKVLSEGSAPHMYEKEPSPLPIPSICGSIAFPADCWRAADTPSVACGDPAVLGEYNCLIAWADTDWYRPLMYAAAKVVPGPAGGHELQLHSVRSGYSSVFGTPSLALDGASDFPWRIAFDQGSSRVFTRRKAKDAEAFLQDGGFFTFSGPVVSPTLGSLRLGGLLPFPRTTIFVTSQP